MYDLTKRQKLVCSIADHLQVSLGDAENILRGVEVEEHRRKEHVQSEAYQEKWRAVLKTVNDIRTKKESVDG